MPDGTVHKECVVTGEEVFMGEWQAYQGQLETELGRALNDDELEEAAKTFLEILGPNLLEDCEATAPAGAHELLNRPAHLPDITRA
jgi:hypothetical protein